MQTLLDEMIPLFDAPDFHIGTDEYRHRRHEAERQRAGRRGVPRVHQHDERLRPLEGKELPDLVGLRAHAGHDPEPDPTVVIDMWVTDNAKGLIDRGNRVINSYHGSTYIVPGAPLLRREQRRHLQRLGAVTHQRRPGEKSAEGRSAFARRQTAYLERPGPGRLHDDRNRRPHLPQHPGVRRKALGTKGRRITPRSKSAPR